MATPDEQEPIQSESSVEDRIASLPDSALAFGDEGNAEPVEDDAATPDEQEPEESDDGDGEAEADDSGDEPEESDDAEPEEGSDEDDPIYEVTLPGGERAEVPLSELVAGYSRNQDYKSKTEQLAAQRREVEQFKTSLQSSVEQERQKLVETLEQLQQSNSPGTPPNMEMLDPNSPNYDPERFLREKANYDQRVADYANRNQELEGHRKKLQQHQQEQMAQAVQQEGSKLSEAWPEWTNDVTAMQTRQQFVSDMQALYGLDAQTIGQVIDHRFFLVARDAIAHRKAQKGAPKVTQRLKAKPKVVKPGTKQKAGNSKALDARKALKKTGSVDHAARAFEGLLDKGLI